MCGIAGHFEFDGIKVEPSIVKLKQSLHKRGPDNFGIHFTKAKNGFLAHSRLSIVDTSPRSNQPFIIEDKIVVVFNGEIYNHQLLKNKISNQRPDINWKTTSDTEVVGNAYLCFGENFTEHFNGMFSIAIFDVSRNKVLLTRDRIGIKPLYYYWKDNCLIWGSEVKNILSIKNNIKFNNNVGNILNYFYAFTSLDDTTYFEHIKRAKPGETITFSKDQKIVKQYWCLLKNSLTNYPSFNLADDLQLAIKQRIPSEVDYNIFLSGGVDSSLIAGDLPHVDSLSISFDFTDQDYLDESKFATMVSSRCDGTHKNLVINTTEFFHLVDSYVKYCDIPIGDPVSLCIKKLSEETEKRKIKVAFVGEGADELFFGYEAWRKIHLTNSLINKLPLKYLPINCIKNRFVKDIIVRKNDNLPLFSGGTVALRYDDLFHFFGKNQFELFYEEHKQFLSNKHSYFVQNSKIKSLSLWMKFFDMTYRLPEVMLSRLDLLGMAHSLETRVPFLDHNNVQKYFYADIHETTTNKIAKYKLKSICAEKFGKDVGFRKKQGFDIPVQNLKHHHYKKKLKQIDEFYLDLKLSENRVSASIETSDRHRAWWLFYSFFRWYEQWI